MLLTRFAVHRPVTTLMGSLIVVLLGWTALTKLRVDLMPETTWPIVSVTTVYPGAGPEEIETLITRPLEQAVGSVQGVERLSSQSVEGSSNLRIQFAWGTDLDPAVGDIRARLERVRESLPPGIEPPYIRKYDSSDEPIMYLGLQTDLPPVQATLFAENVIGPLLERIEGVARLRIRGATRREIQVDLDRQKLESLDMPVTEVLDALRSDNISQPAGDFDEGHLKLLVRSQGEFTSLDQIADTVVRQREGATVQIRDIGTVIDGEEERTHVTRVNGEPGLLIYPHRQTGANTIEVSDAIRAEIDRINATMTDATLTVRMDKSDFIRRAIANVRQAALYGMGLAVLTLILFLRSFRSTLVIAVTMPLSILATFVLIYFYGFTLNMISFGGLALGIGLLVDNSIVVLESIFRKREDGLNRIDAAIEGTQEVASAIVASTLTTLVVFLPLLFIGDQTGIIMRELSAVVAFSLICSLLASVTLTPMLTAHWLPETNGEQGSAVSRFVGRFHRLNRALFRQVERWYGSVLLRSMRVPLIVTFVLMMALAVCVGLVPRIGTEFIPSTDEGRLHIHTEMAPGIQIEQLDRQSKIVEEAIFRSVPESVTTASFVGDESDDGEDWNQAWFSVHLVPREERDRNIDDIRKELEESIGSVPGMEIKVRVRHDSFGSRMFRGGDDHLHVEIRGHDPRTAEELADRVMEAMKRVPGLINVDSTRADQRPELSVRIDRAKSSTLGISVGDITQTLETAIQGTRTTVFREDGNEFNIVVRLRESDRSRLQDLEQVGIAVPDGRIIPLKSVVSFNPGESAVNIFRQDRQRVQYVWASIEDRDLGHCVADLQRELSRLPPVDGFTLRVAGDWEEQQKSFRALTFGFLLAVALMYMVMASQFESFADPLLILLTLPLGAIGVITILLSTETTLNVQSFIGLIMLAGIVVNNAIVLVDYANQLKRRDPELPIDELIRRASVRRLRPILMTTMTTVLAMLPIALGVGDGGELQAPMARVVIGGLTSATLITLLAIPLAWRAAHGARQQTEATEQKSPAPKMAAGTA